MNHKKFNHVSFAVPVIGPDSITTNLRARAGHPFQLPEYTTLLHKKVFYHESLA